MEQLDERKMKILQAIIRNYLETGEPVGSRTISKYTDLNLSSATIRNEMSDLEEMGYIVQPHTSAGRIPTDRGYRLYVDSMMEENARQVEELKEMLVEKDEKMDHLLKQVAKVLAVNTNYATMVTAPRVTGNKVKFIQLSRVSEEQILVVVVAEGNIIKNTMISVSEPIDDEMMLKLNILLNTSLNGLAIDEINLALISRMKTQAGEYGAFIGEVIDAVAETIKEDDDLEVYTSGANNIFKYPELANEQNASGLITAFEEKQILAQLADYNADESETKNGIRVYIGEAALMAKESAQLLISAIAVTPRCQSRSIQVWMSASLSSRLAVSRRALIWSMNPAIPVPLRNSFHI